MRESLETIRFTLRHTLGHVAEAEHVAKEFFQTEPFRTVLEADPSHVGYRILFVQLSEQLPLRISALASDAIKNFRSSLDHLGYAAARAAGKEGRRAYFPFGDSRAEAESRRTGSSSDIPSSILDVMLGFGPYKDGDIELWQLNKLANANKHEALVRASLFARQLVYETPGTWLNVGSKNSSEGKIPVAWVAPDSPPLDFHIGVGATVRFNDTKGATFNTPAFEFLRRVGAKVESVLARVEAEATKLGLLRAA
jgi:hypothetical protein